MRRMGTIKIKTFKSSRLNASFSSVQSIGIEDAPFDSGAYGEVYLSREINGSVLTMPQVVKVFVDDGDDTAKRCVKTIEELQEQIIKRNSELKANGETPIEDVVALKALPQFSFEGQLNGKTVSGYSADFLEDGKWLLFDRLLNEPNKQRRKDFRNLPIETRLNMAYNLVEGFSYLSEMKFIHADLNPLNFFINSKEGELCLIDYDGGAVMNSGTNMTETFGKPGEFLAPEIQSQLIQRKKMITVNLHTDTWAVAIAVHFLLFLHHPFFYLKIGGELEKKYFQKYQWPEIYKTDSNYQLGNDTIYDRYIDELKNQIPDDIVRVMSETFNHGYAEPGRRASYKQWMSAIRKQMQPPTIVRFFADKQEIISGNALKLSWETERANKILLNGDDVTKIGWKDIYPIKNETYTLKIENRLGSAEKTVVIKVLPAPKINNLRANKTKIEVGDSITLEWSVSHTSAMILTDGIYTVNVSKHKNYSVKPTRNTTYKFIAIASDNKTNVVKTINVEVFTALQILFFKAQPSVITDVFSTELSWNVVGAKKVKIDQGIGEVTEQGKIEVRPLSHTSYRLTATGELREIIHEVCVHVLPTPILTSLFVSAPDFESRVGLDKRILSIPQIDVSINMPEMKILDFNLELPTAAESLNKILAMDSTIKYKKSKFNFSEICEYVKEKIKNF